eukprot:Skav236160  [mRNA]  locus=scaffold723:8611:12785:+ [translate_table: standard]
MKSLSCEWAQPLPSAAPENSSMPQPRGTVAWAWSPAPPPPPVSPHPGPPSARQDGHDGGATQYMGYQEQTMWHQEQMVQQGMQFPSMQREEVHRQQYQVMVQEQERIVARMGFSTPSRPGMVFPDEATLNRHLQQALEGHQAISQPTSKPSPSAKPTLVEAPVMEEIPVEEEQPEMEEEKSTSPTDVEGVADEDMQHFFQAHLGGGANVEVKQEADVKEELAEEQEEEPQDEAEDVKEEETEHVQDEDKEKVEDQDEPEAEQEAQKESESEEERQKKKKKYKKRSASRSHRQRKRSRSRRRRRRSSSEDQVDWKEMCKMLMARMSVAKSPSKPGGKGSTKTIKVKGGKGAKGGKGTPPETEVSKPSSSHPAPLKRPSGKVEKEEQKKQKHAWKAGLVEEKPEQPEKEPQEQGEEEEGNFEEDPEVLGPMEATSTAENRDRSKQNKFLQMLSSGHIPEYIAKEWEATKSMKSGKRDKQSLIVNALFDRSAAGKLILNDQKPVFMAMKTNFNEKVKKEQCKTLPRLLFMGKFNLSKEMFEEGLETGELKDS